MFRREYRERRGLGSVTALAMIACVAGVTGCSQPNEGSTSTRSPVGAPGGPPQPGRVLGRVGNQASGIDDQPDFDAFALQIRERVQPQLPDPLPAAATACRDMMDAALTFYRQTEGEDSSAVAAVQRARAGDEKACVAGTSPAAAACVAILLSEQAGEYPWLVDQCSRAFPRS